MCSTADSLIDVIIDIADPNINKKIDMHHPMICYIYKIFHFYSVQPCSFLPFLPEKVWIIISVQYV